MRCRIVAAAWLAGAWLSPAALAQVPPAPPARVAGAQPIDGARLDQYIKGFNFLVGTFGLSDQARLYAAQRIATRPANVPVNVTPGWIGLGDDDLRQARDMEGGALPEVDAAAADLIPILDRLVERLKDLEAYYASHGDLEDGLARGRRENPLVLADFQAAIAALHPLDVALTRLIDRRDMAALVVLKDGGDLVGYDSGMALHGAKRLIGLAGAPGIAQDKQRLAEGDGLADGIVSALTDERAALDTAKASGATDHALRNSMADTAAGELQSVAGAWRVMRHNGAIRPQPMIGAYNAAVRDLNVGN